MLEIHNKSGRAIPLAGVILQAGESIRLDVPYSSIRNAERNGFIAVREVEDENIPMVVNTSSDGSVRRRRKSSKK